MLPERVRFSPFKYGRELPIDAGHFEAWTGIVSNGRQHTLNFHELLLIERGAASIDLNGQRSAIYGPAVVLTRPNEMRRVDVIDPLQLRLVVFTDEALGRLGAAGAIDHLPRGATVRLSSASFTRLGDLADLIAGEIARPWDDSPLMLDALLAQFLVQLRRASPCREAPRRRPALLARLERLVEARFREEHRAAAYAALLGVSADHLSAAIREYDGGSAKSVIQRRVMREATQLLTTTTVRVADIAATLGYHDPAHFARAFTRIVGIAPGRYRQAR